MYKYLFLGLLLILVFSGCTQEQSEEINETEDPAAYSIGDISQHDSKDDCWLAIAGKVYDVTDFISSHPGGEALLQGCGTDATNLYETRPMGSGTPHSQNARNLLENYYVGDLGG